MSSDNALPTRISQGKLPAVRKEDKQDLEIKDAQMIFRQAWEDLEQRLGRENLIFPKEIMWLGGAPGAGKGTNTPFIMRERGMTGGPIEVSSLLNTPEMEDLKAQGKFIGDREVVAILLNELLKEEYQSGVVVDGFPRTKVQTECVKILYSKMLELRTEFFPQPIGPRFRRPIFRITVLFVDEKTSIERQLARGLKVREHNAAIRSGDDGELLAERDTDFDEDLARGRYSTFKKKTFDALQSLRDSFQFHLINAMMPLSEVETSIINEFQYQSSMELGHDTYDTIHRIPVALDLGVHARQELVRRLDNYQHRYTELFTKVVDALEFDFLPQIKRHGLTGKALLRTQDLIFDQPVAVDMAIDVLSERGYHVVYDLDRTVVPERFDLNSGRIDCLERRQHRFEITFEAPVIRRGN